MYVTLKSDIYKSFDSIYVPNLVLRDEYGHCFNGISKVDFRISSKNLCLVTVTYDHYDNVIKMSSDKTRTFILKSCRMDLSCIGLTEDQEKFKPYLETPCEINAPWYIRLAMKVVHRFLEKKEIERMRKRV